MDHPRAKGLKDDGDGDARRRRVNLGGTRAAGGEQQAQRGNSVNQVARVFVSVLSSWIDLLSNRDTV